MTYKRFGYSAMRTAYQEVSSVFDHVVVEGFNDAVCPEPTLHHDMVIGVAPGIAIFYDAEEFCRVLETMTIPPLEQDCLDDYDKLSERLNKLVTKTVKNPGA